MIKVDSRIHLKKFDLKILWWWAGEILPTKKFAIIIARFPESEKYQDIMETVREGMIFS